MMVAIAAVANTGSGSGAPAPSDTASEGARAECEVLRGASGTPVRSPVGAVRNTLDGKGGGSRTHASSSSSERVTLAWAKTDELRCDISLVGSVGHTVAVLVLRVARTWLITWLPRKEARGGRGRQRDASDPKGKS